MHRRQVDIEQNQVRLQFFGLPDGLQPIRRLESLELRPSLKRRADHTAERRMVLDDENPERHLEEPSSAERLGTSDVEHAVQALRRGTEPA